MSDILIKIKDLYEGDIVISDGDFLIGDSTTQDVIFDIVSEKGEWKEFPDLVVGISTYINSSINPLNTIINVITKDGYSVNDLNKLSLKILNK